MVTTPTVWTAAQRITSEAMNYETAAIAELAAESPNLGGRCTVLEAGDVLPCYVGSISGVAQGGNGTNNNGVQAYHSWPTSGSFAGTSSGVQIPTTGKYAITFQAACTSGSFYDGGTAQARVIHKLSKGYNTAQAVFAQTTATVLGASSTAALGGEDSVSITCYAMLNAGDVISPNWYAGHLYISPPFPITYGWSQAVCTCQLTIVRIST
jgi:hypothetical protein